MSWITDIFLLLAVAAVVYPIHYFIRKACHIFAVHHTIKKYDPSVRQRPERSPGKENLIAYLASPASGAVTEYIRARGRYYFYMAAGLVVGLLLLLGIVSQDATTWIAVGLFSAVFVFFPGMACRAFYKQAKTLTDTSALRCMSEENLRKLALDFDKTLQALDEQNRNQWLRLCCIFAALGLLLTGLQADYFLRVRETEPGVLQLARYQYRLQEDGTAEIVRYVGIWETARVPASFQDAPVTSIGPDAFVCPSGGFSPFGRKEVVKVLLPDSLREIGNKAFRECKKLEELTIPTGVTRIGESAFAYCYALKEITLPAALTEIGISAFSSCDALEKIIFPAALTEIGDYAFRACPKLKEVTLPTSLIKIGNEAFAACWELAAINIPDSVTELGDNPFAECPSLQKLTISEDHPVFCVSDQALCRRADGVLIWYPTGNTGSVYRVPENIQKIGNKAFKSVSTLEQVILPEGLVSVGEYAFSGCVKLKTVTLPDSITSIGAYAFYDCKSLTKISIPAGVTEISTGMLRHCTNLNRVTLPEGILTICDYAFYRCSSLQSLFLPESIQRIEYLSVFSEQTVLTVIPGSYAEQRCSEAGLSIRYPNSP